MKKLITTFVKYPFYANLIIAITLIAGLLSLFNMKKAFFPERESRMIQVTVNYPGASPVEMEEGVTTRIEEAIRGIIGIKEINSESSENRSSVNIETTGDYDIDETLMEVKNAVDGITALPSAAERPIVFKQRSRTDVLRLSLQGKTDILTLKAYANQIEDDLLNSGKISQVSVDNAPVPEISIEVEEKELLRYNLTFTQIANAVFNNNRDVSGGEIRTSDEDILIRLRSRSTNTEKIGNIILKAGEDGSFIRIRDVATVKKKYNENYYGYFMNGLEAITINVNKLPEEDMEEITEYCRGYVVDFNKEHPEVALKITRDRLTILHSRLDLLLSNGKIGLILVIIALALFLNVKISLWVAWGIPSSFLAMFFVANLYGITINMVSLFGMIIVIGILVDDGIVIAENIFTHFERGKSPRRSAVDGTLEVMPAVITSVLTTIVAFMPLLYLRGRMEMLFDMAFIVIISLAFSLVEAFFVLPSHIGSSYILNQKVLDSKNKGLRKYLDRFMSWLRDDIYESSLKWLLRWRYPVMAFGGVLAMVTAGLFMGGFIRSTFFPSIDFDSFEVNIAFTPGSGDKQTYEYLTRFEKAIWEVNDELVKEFNDSADIIENVFLSIGSSFSGQESGPHAGRLLVYPRDLEGLDLSGYDISNRVRKKIGNIPEAQKFTIAGRNRWGSPVSISVMSRNLKELQLAKEYLIEELHNIPILKDIVDNNAQGKQEVRLKLKPRAYFLGLDEASIANQIRQGFYGGQIQRLQEGRDELRIWVRYPKHDRASIGQLERMKIKTASGEYPLAELTDYEMERGPVNINRFNGSREARIEADLTDPDASVPDILEQINAEIIPNLKAKYPGVRIVYQGQQKASQEAAGEMRQLFVIAFAVIILILLINFKSSRQTLLILWMIPVSMLGAFWGHGIHAKPVSLLSAWGMVALTGVIINDSVVFLSKFNGLLREGIRVKEAIVQAGKSRLRPIILTSLTTSIGLFPIILEKSVQAQFLIPMAISLAYGIAFGTLFILIFFPVLILILNDISVYLKYLWTGIKPEREAVEVAIKNFERNLDE